MIQANYLLVSNNIENEKGPVSHWLGLTVCTESEMRQLDDNGSIVIRLPRGDDSCIAATDFNTTYGGMLQACEGDDALWNHILCKIRVYDPKIVILDVFPGGEEGDSPASGLDYGTRLKEEYPDMGVLLLAAGSVEPDTPAVTLQQELDNLKSRKGWAIDAALLKPWSEAATDCLTPEQVQEKKKLLFSHSLRPSEN